MREVEEALEQDLLTQCSAIEDRLSTIRSALPSISQHHEDRMLQRMQKCWSH